MRHLRRVLVNGRRDFPDMGVSTITWVRFPGRRRLVGEHVWLGQRFCTDGRSFGALPRERVVPPWGRHMALSGVS